MAELTISESSSDTDRDFDPRADVMVRDYDDEQTLEEEEAMSNGDSVGNELDDLQKESEMPLEDLLAAYRHAELHDSRSSSEEEILSNQDLTLDKDEIARDLLRAAADDKATSADDLLDSVGDMELPPSEIDRMLRSNNQSNSSEDDSEDGDYEPQYDDSWKKTIQVGSDYQAIVPQGMSRYGDAPAYENEDRLLWDPNKLDNHEVDTYLKEVEVQNQASAEGVHSVPVGLQVRDDEPALYLLLQCGHNLDEALRRRNMQAVPPTDPMSLWSEEECKNFETGLRTYGKEFYLIQQNKVRTRSVGELIQFYYLWKKTERHDVFANKTRLEKKKYALHPGITDYMDRFLDEQENPVPLRDRSSSPSVNSLIYADPKRQPPADASSPRAASPCKLAPQQPRTPTLHASLAGFRPISDALSCTVASRASPANSAPSSDAEHSEPSAKRLKTEPALARHTCPAPALPVEGAAGPTAFTRLTNYGDCVGSVALSLASINSSVKILGDAAIGPIASPATLAVTESVVR